MRNRNKLTPGNIVIVDYGFGNTGSVKRRLTSLGFSAAISSNPTEIRDADKLILPGVGHFGEAIQCIRNLGLEKALNHAALELKRPVLGICLGMQLMAQCSEEGGASGLGWFEAKVIRLPLNNRKKYRLPHVGWNRLHHRQVSQLTQAVQEGDEMYFLHSYCWHSPHEDEVISEVAYEHTFPAIVSRDNIYGIQCHPEKSHEPGSRILHNFACL